MTRLLSALMFAAAAGCGQIYAYPDPEVEAGPSSCSDERDNDFDGATDCADSDCDGQCPEASRAECSDGRDNDGDGLVDARDPRCWLIEPPKTQRCAEASGVEMIASFDTPPQVGNESSDLGFWPWRAFGASAVDYVVKEDFHSGPDRSDGLVRFLSNKNEQSAAIRGVPDVFARSLGALVRQLPFAGIWQDFELSFGLSVPQQAMLRVAVLPVELAGSADAPAPGAASALLSVTVDTTSSPGALVLGVEGALYREDLPAAPSCEGSPCLARLSVASEPNGLRTWLVFADGSRVEVSGTAPSSPSLPPARLAFWGGTATEGDETPVLLDDVRLRVAPERPCGFDVPQLPEETCPSERDYDAFGQTVSVTRGAAGEFCALVSASHSAAEPRLPLAEALTTWTSADGQVWHPAAILDSARLELPEHAELIGGGIASSDEGLHAVVTYRDGGRTQLGFLSGRSCADWSAIAPGPELFGDAESASYVVKGEQHAVYFTRAPDNLRRTLWRLDLASAAEPELVAELPAFVEPPVNVQRIGDADLVLTYPEINALGNPGVGLLVESDAGYSRPASFPLLPPPRPDLPEGEGRIAFDDRGVAAAALSFQDDGALLLYTGRSTTGRFRADRRGGPVLGVGTARFAAADQELPTTSTGPSPEPARTGDDALLRDPKWRHLSSAVNGAFTPYFTDGPRTLHWGGGDPAWSVLPLERQVGGDFELAFDLWVSFAAARGPACSLYVGLASGNDGVFARAKRDSTCLDSFAVTPFVASPNGPSDGAADGPTCSVNPDLETDGFQRVVLRRSGTTLEVRFDRRDGCAPVEQRLQLASPLPSFDELRIGFGGDGFDGCSGEAGGGGAVTDLTLEAP